MSCDVKGHQTVEGPSYRQPHGGPVQQLVDDSTLQVDGDAIRLLQSSSRQFKYAVDSKGRGISNIFEFHANGYSSVLIKQISRLFSCGEGLVLSTGSFKLSLQPVSHAVLEEL